MPVVVAVDVGSTSARAGVFDGRGIQPSNAAIGGVPLIPGALLPPGSALAGITVVAIDGFSASSSIEDECF